MTKIRTVWIAVGFFGTTDDNLFPFRFFPFGQGFDRELRGLP